MTSTASTFFYVDTNTYNPPVWLTVGGISGPANSVGVTVELSPAQYCLTMVPGVYNATIAFDVLGNYLPKTVTVKLTVNAAPPALNAAVNAGSPASMFATCVFTPNPTAPAVVCDWSSGAAPVLTVSLASSGTPISFTTTSAMAVETSSGVVGTTAFYAVANPATVSPSSSIGYSWGTPITVTFSTQAFLQAQAGDSVAEIVTITPASGSPIALYILINVTAPIPLITSTSPALVPVDSNPGDVITVVLNGSGFVPSSVPGNEASMVYYCTSTDPSTCMTNEPNVTVVSPTELIVSYPVTTNGFTSMASPWYIGVCNPMGGPSCTPAVPASVAAVTVTTVPIVAAVTSASTFVQGATSFAPYDIVSIFGQNFCPGCLLLATPTLTFTPDAANNYRYPTSASPDSTNYLTVAFYDNASTPNQIGLGYLLFGNNTQINVLVPAAVASSLGSGNIRVGYGATPVYSACYPVTYAATDPGIFTVNESGAGQGAILNYDWTANSASNPVSKGGTSSQRVVHIYLTGLGVPTSTGNINTAGPSTMTAPNSCVAITGTNGFLAAANTVYGLTGSSAWTSLDGALINNAILNNGTKDNHLPPCITPNPAVTIGGVAATVTYAGWVEGAVAGLYQIDAQVATKVVLANAPSALPVVVSIGTKNIQSSQAGVTVEVTN
ncbi:MAG: hypothetical protein ACLQVN_20965 [Bryobacteraceae bacterium]